jgi:hypothetical protein
LGRTLGRLDGWVTERVIAVHRCIRRIDEDLRENVLARTEPPAAVDFLLRGPGYALRRLCELLRR